MWIVHKVTKSWPVEETPEGETPDIQHRKSPMKGDKKEKGKVRIMRLHPRAADVIGLLFEAEEKREREKKRG